jgi:hypothetical protein
MVFSGVLNISSPGGALWTDPAFVTLLVAIAQKEAKATVKNSE